tara:strand:- start:286 stop:717 length:432 start_codon:yes stop_codon:yes gene_type:complete
MKKFIFLLLLIPTTLAGQSEVPAQYWIGDDNFEDTINRGGGFDDDDSEVIVVEFWAEFNKDNAFSDWKKLSDLDGVSYFRIDIATSPRLKKELRIRMAPTLLLYTKGDAYIKFKAKAGLDLLCPVDYPKMLRAIEVVKQESAY